MNEILLPNIVMNVNGHDRAGTIFDYDLEKRRTVYITGEITNWMAMSVCAQIRYLASKCDEDIMILINSPGGSVTAGFAIYDVLKSVHCDIITAASGQACSMGCFLLAAAGNKGKRFASASTDIMMHQPMTAAQGQATDIGLVAEHVQQTKVKIARLLAEACGKTPKRVLTDTERDYWLAAEEALAYGLIDHIGFPDDAGNMEVDL